MKERHVGKCEGKPGSVITPGAWKYVGKNSTEGEERKQNQKKKLASIKKKEKKQDFVYIERISSPLEEFVVLYCSQIPNFARATEKASVPHVAKIMTEFLELEFQVVVSSHRDGGNQTRVPCKDSHCSTPWSHLSRATEAYV